jgi:hypothetical protein
MNNLWDKNDPRDAQVILHLVKTGLGQTWCDPLLDNSWASLVPIPEIECFLRSSHVDWLVEFLRHFPAPATITFL